MENKSDPIRFISNQFEMLIRNESGSIQTRISPNCIFNHHQSESFRPRMHSDWFELEIRFGSIRVIIDPDRFLLAFRIESE